MDVFATGRFAQGRRRQTLTMRPHRHRAFTLIEVLISLAILALAGIVLASAYVNVLLAQETVLRRDERAPILRLIREELRAQSDRTLAEKWNPIVLPDGGQAKWRAVITPTTIADLFAITLEAEISIRTQDVPETYTETCHLLRPSWSEPGERETLRADARQRLKERVLP